VPGRDAHGSSDVYSFVLQFSVESDNLLLPSSADHALARRF